MWFARSNIPSGSMQGGKCLSLVFPVPFIVPLQQFAAPPGRILQPAPPHVPQDCAQQTSSALIPVLQVASAGSSVCVCVCVCACVSLEKPNVLTKGKCTSNMYVNMSHRNTNITLHTKHMRVYLYTYLHTYSHTYKYATCCFCGCCRLRRGY